jgi:hypothetical protein
VPSSSSMQRWYTTIPACDKTNRHWGVASGFRVVLLFGS